MKKSFALVLGLVVLLIVSPAWADEISDQIEMGLKLYKEGKVAEALSELDFAVAQLRQKKAEGMGVIFPEPLAGWEAEEVESESMGQAMFGGGIKASRAYKHKDGQGRAEIEVLSDSPMIQTFAMFLNNPQMMQGGKKGKLIRVAKQKAILSQENKDSAEVQLVFNNKVLVKVEVSDVANAAEVATDYAEKINYDKLGELTK